MKENKEKTVLLLNFKGGVGKTLIADELLYKLEKDKIPTSFINFDEQESASHETCEPEGALVKIVDTPGFLNDEFKDMIEEADFIIVPSMISPSDQKPLESMIEILEPYQSSKEILFVFNGWDRCTYTRDFINYFNEAYPEIKTTILARTTAFRDAKNYGMSLEDYSPSNPAVKQIDHIYSSVKYSFNLKDWRML